MLLVPSDSAFRKLVRKCRKRMIQAYKANMAITREFEIGQYGKNSYYKLMESRRYHVLWLEGDCVLGDEPAGSESDDQLDKAKW